MKWIDSFDELAAQYDAFLLDLWGVVHDGTQLYPGARETLVQLKAADKKIVFVSNAPRRAAKVQSVLAGFGVAEADYLGAVSSGEAAFQWLRDEKLQPGKLYYYIGPDRDADVLDGLDFKPVSIDEAEFVLNVGFGSETQTPGAWMPELEQCHARELPMLCLNPDIEVVKISGERYPCAGAIARDYENLGGSVRYFGKPYPEVYRLAMEMVDVPRQKMIAVGDSLHTDIEGALHQGIASVLVTGGILKQSLGQMDAARTAQPEFVEYCRTHGGVPDYVMPEFCWA